MAGNLVKSVMLRIVADDGDSEAKLDRITARADELAAKHPELKVKVDSAAASAKLAVLRRELKDTANAEKQAGDGADGLKGRFAALGQAANILGAGGLGKSESMFAKGMLAMNVATGLGEPLLAGAVVAAGALSAGLVSAGAGLGIFGIVAKAVYTKVSGALTNLTAAQQAYSKATTSAGRATALKQEQAAMAGLTGSQKKFAVALTTSKNEWSKFVNAASPGVTSVMAAGLALLPKALSLMKPFLVPVENALRMIIGELSQGLNSKGFASFLGMLRNEAPTMIVGMARAIGNVVVGIGGILRAFMPMSDRVVGGIDSITAKFAKWGTTLSGHSGFQSLMGMFKSETPLAVSVLTQLAGIIKIVVSQMTGMSTVSNSKTLLQLAVPVLAFANALLKAHPQLVWLVLYLKMASDGGKKLKVAFEGLSGAFSAIKGGQKALSGLAAGLKDAEAGAQEGATVWTKMGSNITGVFSAIKSGAVSAVKGGAAALSGLKAGLTDTEAAAQAGATVWTTMGSNIAGAVTAVKGWSIWTKIAGAATKVWTGIQAAFDVVMDANPIMLIVIAVAALVAAFVLVVIKCKPVRDFFKALWRDLKTWFSEGINWIKSHWKLLPAIFLGPLGVVVTLVLTHFKQIKNLAMDLWNNVKHLFSDGVNFVVGHWRLLATILATALLGPIGGVIAFVATHWAQFTSLTARMVGDVTHWFESLPGRILGALSGLGSLLFNAGVHAIEQLASGFESMASSAVNAVKHIVSDITDLLPGSPARKGPLSGSGWTRVRGQHLARDMAMGMTDGLPGVHGVALKMAGVATAASSRGPVAGTHHAGAGSRGVTDRIILEFTTADSQIMTALANAIRVRGGDPRILSRKVVLA
jgi:hypothetical protein